MSKPSKNQPAEFILNAEYIKLKETQMKVK